VKYVTELVALANRSLATCNTPPPGSEASRHIGGELFTDGGVDIRQVPFQRRRPAMVDIVGGIQGDVFFHGCRPCRRSKRPASCARSATGASCAVPVADGRAAPAEGRRARLRGR